MPGRPRSRRTHRRCGGPAGEPGAGLGIGRWRTTTLWEPIPGAGVQQSHGRFEAEWVFGGRVVEARSFDATGVESARLLMAFDPTIGDYAAFTVHALSTFFEIERGRVRRHGAGTLAFDSDRAGAGGPTQITFRRTFHFQDPDTIDDPDTFRVVITLSRRPARDLRRDVHDAPPRGRLTGRHRRSSPSGRGGAGQPLRCSRCSWD